MCSAAFITLGCVLRVEMIIVITRWKAADERLSLPLMSYLSTHAWCRVHRFCFWMIYCCVKVAYVLLKLALVNDRECVLNTLPAMGAVFSHLHLWEHQSQSPSCSPAGTPGAGPGYICVHTGHFYRNTIEYQPFKTFLEDTTVLFAYPILLIKETVLHDTFWNVLGAFLIKPFLFSSSVAFVFPLVPLLLHFIPFYFSQFLARLAAIAKKR